MESPEEVPTESPQEVPTESPQEGPTVSPLDGPAIVEPLSAYNIEIAKKKTLTHIYLQVLTKLIQITVYLKKIEWLVNFAIHLPVRKILSLISKLASVQTI